LRNLLNFLRFALTVATGLAPPGRRAGFLFWLFFCGEVMAVSFFFRTFAPINQESTKKRNSYGRLPGGQF